jgi:YVTN family beta-propeller protein
VANRSDNTVSVVNTAANAIVTTVPVGSDPVTVALTRFLDNDSGFAQLNGPNTFTGNQTVSGAVTATTFVGDGAGLTGVAAATANTANFATAAIFADSAGNALSLGGFAPGRYARLDIGNNFTGDQLVTGNVTTSGTLRVSGPVAVGGGTPIVEYVSTTLNNVGLGALSSGSCTQFTTPAPRGYIPGTTDTVIPGIPSSFVPGTSVQGASALNVLPHCADAETENLSRLSDR